MSVADNIGITPKLLGSAGRTRLPRGSTNCSIWCGSTARAIATAFRMNCPAAQRQRVGVARALAAKPRIVLMDEPFGALDPLTRDALGDDYRALHRKLGLTTVMITHDMTEAILLADRIAVMRGGRLLAQGTPAELSAQRRRLCRRIAAHAAAAGRAAERAAAAGWRGMNCFADPRWSEALAHLPDYLGNHVRVCVTALALGLAVSLPLAIAARNRPIPRGALLAVRQHRADGAGAGAAGAVLSAAAGAGGVVAVVVRRRLLRVRISAGGAGAGALFDAAGAAQHHHRPCRASIPRSSRPRRASA